MKTFVFLFVTLLLCISAKKKHSFLQKSQTCQNGTYLFGGACAPCFFGCLNCNSMENCTECDTENNYIPSEMIAGFCTCKPNFYIKLDYKTNKFSCQPLPSEKESGKKKHFSRQGDCQKGTFPHGSACIPCLNGCLSCSSFDKCTECDVEKHFVLSKPMIGFCTCEAGFYFKWDGKTSQFSCAAKAACGANCLECNPVGDLCTRCEQDFSLNNQSVCVAKTS